MQDHQASASAEGPVLGNEGQLELLPAGKVVTMRPLESASDADQVAPPSSTILVLKSNPGSFTLAPELILLRPNTNLYDTPATWLLRTNKLPSHKQSLLALLNEAEEGNSTNWAGKRNPDFAADNRVLKDVLSWQYSERLVSVVIHRVGETLVLQGMAPLFTESPAASPQFAATLVSGFDLTHPPSDFEDSALLAQTSLEEQSRLRQSATNEVLAQQQRKKNPDKQKRAQLFSKLHYRMLEENGFKAISPEDSVTVHQWQHRDHNILLTSDLVVYHHKKRPTTLNLRDAKDGPYSKSSMAKLFLDNVMAGVPQLAVCWHEDGVIRRYETFKTHEIPTRLNEQDPLEVADLEKTATTLLSFLKAFCKQDFSTHWLFRSRGDNIARLWRLHPERDASMEPNFRGKVLFQLSMLCLRTSTAGKHAPVRELALLEKSIELLDVAATLPGSSPRRPIRAALRERVADLLLSNFDSSYSRLLKAMNLVEAADDILEQELEHLGSSSLMVGLDNPGRRIASKMTAQARRRLAQRGLLIILSLKKAVKEQHPLADDDMLHSVQQLLERAIDRGERLLCADEGEADSDELSSSPFFFAFNNNTSSTATLAALRNSRSRFHHELMINARLALAEILMSRAKLTARRGNAESMLVAESMLKRAVDSCCTKNLPLQGEVDEEDDANFVTEQRRICFLKGNACNELGKILLARMAVSDAKQAFLDALDAFCQAEDAENATVARLNIAHTYRTASQTMEDQTDVATKRTLLRLAIDELQIALSQANRELSKQWEARVKAELSKTWLLLGLALKGGDDTDIAIEAFQHAVDTAATEGDMATALFHCGRLRWSRNATTKMDMRLAKRQFERTIEITKDDNLLNLYARAALIELLYDTTEMSPERALKSLLVESDVVVSEEVPIRERQQLYSFIEPILLRLVKALAAGLQNGEHKERVKEVYRQLLIRRTTPSAFAEKQNADLSDLLTFMRKTLIPG